MLIGAIYEKVGVGKLNFPSTLECRMLFLHYLHLSFVGISLMLVNKCIRESFNQWLKVYGIISNTETSQQSYSIVPKYYGSVLSSIFGFSIQQLCRSSYDLWNGQLVYISVAGIL